MCVYFAFSLVFKLDTIPKLLLMYETIYNNVDLN